MLQNQFFKRNKIHNYVDQKPLQVAKIRSKRSQSVVSLKADPSKFLHRQVFDSKIYTKVNFFKLGLNELQQQYKKQSTTSSMLLEDTFNKIGKIIDEPSTSQTFINYSNHWNLLPESKERCQTHEGINQILVSFLKNIISKINIILSSRAQLEQKLKRVQSQLIISRKTYNQPLLRGQRLNSVKEQRQKNWKQKNYQLDFFLKKEKLRVKQLQEQIIDKEKMINELSSQNKKMLEQKQKQVAYHEMMEYRVKRLKEQLQVAHIIKQQNLADKMKYIMNW